MKIDVEGGELEVLQGLTGTIARDRPAIICEVLPVYDTTNDRGRRRRTRCDALTAILRERGYTIIRIRHEGHWEPLDHIPTHGDMSLVDYVFAPSEIAEDFLRTSVSP